MSKRFLVTGGAGFIGSAMVRHLIGETDHSVCVVDKLSYAGNLDNLRSVQGDPRYAFRKADICDRVALDGIFAQAQPDVVMHLAAESHVDRSIDAPAPFVQTNLVGTATLLEAARAYWSTLAGEQRAAFRFHHVSTDEVYGSLPPDACFSETSPYRPNSPYAASKAGADHLCRAWRETYGLPVVISNASNNYGPYQFPEKLVPLTILNAFAGNPLPVYGDGLNVRDWLHVEDHAEALVRVALHGRVGETYLVGADCARTNLEMVQAICGAIDELMPSRRPTAALIAQVEDRPGHDRRYAVDAGKIRRELGWTPRETFDSGIRHTVAWYHDNPEWVGRVLSGDYRLERLGRAS